MSTIIEQGSSQPSNRLAVLVGILTEFGHDTLSSLEDPGRCASAGGAKADLLLHTNKRNKWRFGNSGLRQSELLLVVISPPGLQHRQRSGEYPLLTPKSYQYAATTICTTWQPAVTMLPYSM